jgi:yecA family protein
MAGSNGNKPGHKQAQEKAELGDSTELRELAEAVQPGHASYPSLIQITDSLERLDNHQEPTETHGLLCAFLCAGAKMRVEAWISSLVGEQAGIRDESFNQAKTHLRHLFKLTQNGLEDGDFGFDLLLPEDDVELYVRIESFSLWCQGFVSGLNLAGVSLKSQEIQQVQEAIDDLVNFSCLQYDEEDPEDEANEKAYSELVEYARVAVMLLYAEKDHLIHNRFSVRGNQTVH